MNSKGRIHLLKRIIEVQNITLEHTKRGVTQQWVYDNVIYPRFFIAQRTYYKYLGYPAKKEFKELERELQNKGC